MDWNLIVSVMVLIGTLALIWLTARMIATKKPQFRLDRIVVNPWSPFQKGRWLDIGKPIGVRLVFMNDGPGMAPATTITVRGLPIPGVEEVRYPKDGNPTLPPGGVIEVEASFPTMESTERWPERNFIEGDDIRLDLQGLSLTFEWQHGKKRLSSTITDAHTAQRSVPVLVIEQPPGLFD